MRDFMNETELEKAKMSLDAHHCNLETMTQIEQAGGQYFIQVKETNQNYSTIVEIKEDNHHLLKR